VANLNRLHFVEKCVESYLELKNLGIEVELVVVDGGSTDGSLEYLRQFADSITSEADNSVYEAWNKGIKKAKNDWVFFLNTDDYVLAKNFSLLFQKYESTTYEMIKFPVLISGNKKIFRSRKLKRIPKYNFRNIISEPCYFNGYLFRRSVFSRVGLFNENYKNCADQEFLWRCLLEGVSCLNVNYYAYEYLSHAHSLTLKKNINLFKEEYELASNILTRFPKSKDSDYAKLWQAWEQISMERPRKFWRIVFRLKNMPTFLHQIFSVKEKIDQKLTSSKIFLSKMRQKVWQIYLAKSNFR
jgi:glycosyltransferase involved in cell wall biosynthesis